MLSSLPKRPTFFQIYRGLDKGRQEKRGLEKGGLEKGELEKGELDNVE